MKNVNNVLLSGDLLTSSFNSLNAQSQKPFHPKFVEMAEEQKTLHMSTAEKSPRNFEDSETENLKTQSQQINEKIEDEIHVTHINNEDLVENDSSTALTTTPPAHSDEVLPLINEEEISASEQELGKDQLNSEVHAQVLEKVDNNTQPLQVEHINVSETVTAVDKTNDLNHQSDTTVPETLNPSGENEILVETDAVEENETSSPSPLVLDVESDKTAIGEQDLTATEEEKVEKEPELEQKANVDEKDEEVQLRQNSRTGIPESVNISNLMPPLAGIENEEDEEGLGEVETVKGWEEKKRQEQERLAKMTEKDRTIYQSIDFAKKNPTKEDGIDGDDENNEKVTSDKTEQTSDGIDLEGFDPSAYFKPSRKSSMVNLDAEDIKKDLQAEQDELFGEARTTRRGTKDAKNITKETVPAGEENLARGILKELSETEW